MPVDAVPEDAAAVMHAFVGNKDAQAVANFAAALIDSAFEGVPSVAGSSKSPPKVKVRLRMKETCSLDRFRLGRRPICCR